jgi:hypothetical protein
MIVRMARLSLRPSVAVPFGPQRAPRSEPCPASLRANHHRMPPDSRLRRVSRVDMRGLPPSRPVAGATRLWRCAAVRRHTDARGEFQQGFRPTSRSAWMQSGRSTRRASACSLWAHEGLRSRAGVCNMGPRVTAQASRCARRNARVGPRIASARRGEADKEPSEMRRRILENYVRLRREVASKDVGGGIAVEAG